MSAALTAKLEFNQPVNVPVSVTKYRLVCEYSYLWQIKNDLYSLTIPAGFVCDGASVPRICWTLTGLTPDGLIRAAATVHDFIYTYKGDLPLGSFGRENNFYNLKNPSYQYTYISQNWTRKQADKMFARLMREAGVSKFRRRLAYLAVRSFGMFYWK